MSNRHRETPSIRRRRAWLLCASVSAPAAVAAAVWLVLVTQAYFRLPLADRDSNASVVSMFLGAAALLVSAASLAVAILQFRREAGVSTRGTATETGTGLPEQPSAAESRPAPTMFDDARNVQVGIARDNGRLFQAMGGNVIFHASPTPAEQTAREEADGDRRGQ